MNFIKKINKYLLENYPIIWNTRLVWMLGIGMLTHILFFILGYVAVTNQEDIVSQYNLKEFYYDTSIVYYNILLSIIILLIWVIYYIQNNAFKNFYKLKKGTLLLHFFIVCGIVFLNISQHYSFYKGIKLKVRNLYDWKEVDADIKQLNNTAVFLNNNKTNYGFKNKKYPKPFPLEYSETEYIYRNQIVDTTKAYIKRSGRYYQFYKRDTGLIAKDEEALRKRNGIENGSIEVEEVADAINHINVNDFKYRLVEDVSFYKDDLEYCLVNYSETLFKTGQTAEDYEQRIKYYEAFFNNADEDDIKEQLSSFLSLAKKYNIKNNLNIDDWYYFLNENNYEYEKTLIEENKNSYNIYEIRKKEKARKNYKITQYILQSEAKHIEKDKYYFTKKIEVPNRIIAQKERDVYYKGKYYPPIEIEGYKLYSNYDEVKLDYIPYCNLKYTDRFFDSIHEAYFKIIDKEIIYVYIMLSLVVGLLLLLFKATDIKTILLSVVAGTALIMIVAIISKYIPRNYNGSLSSRNITNISFLLIISSVIITSIVAFRLRWPKIITAVLFSLAIFAIPFLFIFSMEFYKDSIPYDLRYKDLMYQAVKEYSFYIITIIWLIGIFLYTGLIRKWKGLPE